ncbi:pentatricopeptide repeat-containing protein At3g22670, mitochondrial-like isoform X2 [Humulus lupulus]|nr:pentatricopeptide repeat-containing protein At3g22670, mitochondrial-like isoform X2 [Humulus lupulus]
MSKVSTILHKRFSSPEEVSQALNERGLALSDSLVQQFLMRFSNEWVLAFDFFIWAQTQKDYEHSPESYNLMVDILGKARKFQLLWDLIEEMNSLDGYVSSVTMTKVVRRLVGAHLYKEGIDVFRGIERFGINKDITGLNILMEALVKENGIEHAQEVFLEYKDSIPVNTHSFNLLILGWCKVRKFGIARKTMEEMEKHGCQPNAFSYTWFIKFYCHHKDFRNVEAILDEMKVKGCSPTVVTYTIVMNALGKANQINEALEVYEKMKENGCVPSTCFFNSLIFILGKAGMLKDVEEVFNDMPKKGATPDVITYSTLISCYCDHSQEEKALKLLKKMEDRCCKPELKTYIALLKMCCKKKRMKLLYCLLNHMYNNNVSIDVPAYGLLISGLIKSERIEHACFFFKEMVSKELIPLASTYDTLTNELEAMNMVEEKEKIVELMMKAKKTLTIS